MENTALARRIRDKGLALGLGALGIAAVEPSAHAESLKEWLRAGRAGRMGWMERTREARLDLKGHVPWARAAVVAAVPYLPYKDDRRLQAGLLAHVARYAVGRDYHRVLGERLTALAGFIESESKGARTRVYTDTGPVLERELAARAGLGWFGKNTNLIGPRGNSWLLLGQVITDIDLPADEPVSDRCGSCTACIDACPTGAILEPYLVDSTRCISYLTIELRGAVPSSQRADLGDWVFGCDVCQEVCPWNRKTEPVDDTAFLPARHLEEKSLADLVGLDQQSYQETFRTSAMERPRRRGLVRNALIVAANARDGEALDAAEKKLDDPDPVVRGAAAWALGRAGTGRSRRALLRSREHEQDPQARAEIEAALDGGAPVEAEVPAGPPGRSPRA
jgi:epoxyqueuosine reductase